MRLRWRLDNETRAEFAEEAEHAAKTEDTRVSRREFTFVSSVSFVFLVCIALAAQPSPLSLEAGSHLDEIVNTFRAQWVHRDGFDWESFRQHVHQKAGGAQTVAQTYDAIRLALTLLGDRHSYYVSSSEDYIYSPQSPIESTHECTPAAAAAPSIPPDIGYVHLVTGPAARAAAIQSVLRNADRAATVGWIVDLRDSRDDNMWAALDGIGALAGDGTLGFFVDGLHKAIPWGYSNGEAWMGPGEFVGRQTYERLDMPYQLRAANRRVAVLTDISVASSGEALAIAFRGRPDTRSFGTATCGLSTAVDEIPLRTGGRLGIVTSVMADRTKKEFGGPVVPDEVTSNPADAVPRAIAWLHQR